ncbi:MAG TPA: methyltransferase domain-containing protein [Candidatus Omnitrophota bacterium]|nr:methyltransferase domain-containing protein [Candidatus Omnitrophota bacterium]
MKSKLVIGSAGKIHLDAVTLDIDSEHNPDVVHDLMEEPYPFKDNTFEEIIAHHVLEHLDKLTVFMNEIHRVCKTQGKIYIEVPHHTSWCAYDPFHRAYFNYFSFDGFIEGNLTWIKGKKYSCMKKEITFHKYYRIFFCINYLTDFHVFMKDFFVIFSLQNILKSAYSPLNNKCFI